MGEAAIGLTSSSKRNASSTPALRISMVLLTIRYFAGQRLLWAATIRPVHSALPDEIKLLSARIGKGSDYACKDPICEAIARKRLLQFSYGNHTRMVEPHILGRDSGGHNIFSAYLVSGYSDSRKQAILSFERRDASYNARRVLFRVAQRL